MVRMAQFNDTILDHFKNPRNAGNLENATAVVETSNPVCGDVLRLSVLVQNGKIQSARFKVQGCVAAIASGSALTEMLAGKNAKDIDAITPQQISHALGGLPPATFHAAQLCVDALAALRRTLKS